MHTSGRSSTAVRPTPKPPEPHVSWIVAESKRSVPGFPQHGPVVLQEGLPLPGRHFLVFTSQLSLAFPRGLPWSCRA